jgi:hypothetical protein
MRGAASSDPTTYGPGAIPTVPYEDIVWRMIEGQHVVSTMALVDTLQEQAVLERLLDATKPAIPEDCRHLHYLMSAPFRYGVYPVDSRFRRRGRTPGVFYASEHSLTAAAETIWYRMQFFDASPGTPLPAAALIFTALAVRTVTLFAVDLTAPPLSERAADWTDPDDYSACLFFADAARAGGVEIIRYTSVRDPQARANVALLTCRAFAEHEPAATESWRIRLSPGRALALRDFPRLSVEFTRQGTRLARSF